MKHLPTRANARGSTFTVADFLEAGRQRLRLTLLAGGSHLERIIHEPIVNRPGLALTGFYEHFAWGRVQLIGNGEVAYLKSLDRETAKERIKSMVDHKAFLFICTNGFKPKQEILEFVESLGAVVISTPFKTRIFANLATFVLGSLSAPTATLYGTMVEVAGIGVLIEGDPGLGKSETALGLIKRGCALVADDLTCIRKDVANDTLYASASDSTAGFMEIRGIGIVHIPSMFGVNSVRQEKRIHLVITFRRLDEVRGDIDRVGQRRRYRTILGVDVPNVVIPVSEGRELVNLVETAVKQQKLKFAGHNPVEELSLRLRRRAEESMNAKISNRKG